MRKRVVDKKTKQRQLTLLNRISEYFDIKNAVFGNGYFLFTFGKNMVCHFELKALPEWQFGIWLNKDDRGFRIFGEHKMLIDKFKPSRTYVSKKLKNIDQLDKTFIPTIKSIINKPYLHFDRSLHFGYRSGEDPKKVYDDFMDEKKRKQQLEVQSYLNMKEAIKEVKNNPLVCDVELKDTMEKGWVSYPRYEVDIILKDRYIDELVHEYDDMKKKIEEKYNECRAEICWYS